MGNRLDGFDIELRFNNEGKVETAEYADGGGCGHSREIDPYATTVWELIEYHLSHYKRSHRMEPARLCGFTLDHPNEADIKFVCNLEPHIGDEHQLAAKRVK